MAGLSLRLPVGIPRVINRSNSSPQGHFADRMPAVECQFRRLARKADLLLACRGAEQDRSAPKSHRLCPPHEVRTSKSWRLHSHCPMRYLPKAWPLSTPSGYQLKVSWLHRAKCAIPFVALQNTRPCTPMRRKVSSGTTASLASISISSEMFARLLRTVSSAISTAK